MFAAQVEVKLLLLLQFERKLDNLEPIFFSLYINNLPDMVCNNVHLQMYAEDVVILAPNQRTKVPNKLMANSSTLTGL